MVVMRCRYADCPNGYPEATDAEQITCTRCRADLSLPPLQIVYTRADTKPGEVCRVDITPEYKIRRFNDGTAKGYTDRCWILYRWHVPHLTDQDWYAAPGDGWQRTEEG